MNEIHKDCGGKIIPTYFINEAGRKCLDVLVCQGCFKEFPTDWSAV